MKRLGAKTGFTLSELLIALAILGVIATFTIPKVLQNHKDSKYKAIAKETAGALTAAYDAYRLKNTPNAGTTPGNLTPYLNYVVRDTASAVDWEYNTAGSEDCGIIWCLRLHNGAILYYYGSNNFSGTASTNAIYFYLDPDGTSDGTATNSGKSVLLWLYYNGAITSWTNAKPNTITQGLTYNPVPAADPPWFSWD